MFRNRCTGNCALLLSRFFMIIQSHQLIITIHSFEITAPLPPHLFIDPAAHFPFQCRFYSATRAYYLWHRSSIWHFLNFFTIWKTVKSSAVLINFHFSQLFSWNLFLKSFVRLFSISLLIKNQSEWNEEACKTIPLEIRYEMKEKNCLHERNKNLNFPWR